MNKILYLIIAFMISLAALTGCTNGLFGNTPPASTKPVNEGIKIGDPEKFGKYMENNQMMGMFVSKNNNEIKFKVIGEIITIKIPKDYNMKRIPNDIPKDQVVVITYSEKDKVKYLEQIEVVVSMRN